MPLILALGTPPLGGVVEGSIARQAGAGGETLAVLSGDELYDGPVVDPQVHPVAAEGGHSVLGNALLQELLDESLGLRGAVEAVGLDPLVPAHRDEEGGAPGRLSCRRRV